MYVHYALLYSTTTLVSLFFLIVVQRRRRSRPTSAAAATCLGCLCRSFIAVALVCSFHQILASEVCIEKPCVGSGVTSNSPTPYSGHML